MLLPCGVKHKPTLCLRIFHLIYISIANDRRVLAHLSLTAAALIIRNACLEVQGCHQTSSM